MFDCLAVKLHLTICHPVQQRVSDSNLAENARLNSENNENKNIARDENRGIQYTQLELLLLLGYFGSDQESANVELEDNLKCFFLQILNAKRV